MDVSIVISAFGREDKIPSLLQSISSTCFGIDYEVILVDGSLDDRIRLHVESAGNRFRYVQNLNDCGPAHARQAGISLALGRYIAFLDTDDFFLDDKLKKQFIFMNENNYSFTYTSYEILFPQSGRIFVRHPLKSFNYFKALITRGIALSTVMIRNTQEWQDVASHIVPRGEDYFWWLLYLRGGKMRRAILCPIVGSRIVMSEDSISRDRLFHHSEIFKYYKKLTNSSFLGFLTFFCYFIYAGSFKIKSLVFARKI
ncbi:MAG: hypothetical protein CL687_00035 [Candidatus Pelagibacter sp.]|nr:hypothetical protein [Candidatus Pelagibacter sp.]